MHRSRIFIVAVLAVLVGSVVGCASTSGPASSYSSAQDRTTYRSDDITIIPSVSGTSLGTSASVNLSGIARCSGQGCTPQQVTLIFALDSSSGQFGLTNNTVVLNTDSNEYVWSSQGTEPMEEVTSVTNVIRTVTLPLDELASIAESTSIEGRVGTQPFSFSESQTSKLRRFVDLMRSGGTSSSSG